MTRILFFATMLVLVPIARAEEWEPAKTHAVFVGVLEWKNGLSGYSKKNRKDQELYELLIQRGVPKENTILLLDKDANLPKIRSALKKTLERASKGSTLIVYFCGHGMPSGGNDFCFANYEIQPGRKETGWSMRELAATIANGFKGNRVILWADCCFSGGLELVVDAAAEKKIAAVNLTSASTANTSTNNWTFTQSIIDGLRGDSLVDKNGDGRITLGELNVEVREAMKHMEGQRHGYKAKGISEELVLAKASGSTQRTGGKFPLGSYVETDSRGKDRFGRVVGYDGDRAVVQFYDYSDKRTVKFDVAKLNPSTREPGAVAIRANPQAKPDCEVEWNGTWYPAKILKRDVWDVKWTDSWHSPIVKKKPNPRFFITYIGYESSWNEWVGKERIKMK